MGTILHTGDMRWNNIMFKENPTLFPPEKSANSLVDCAIDIDELIFDNTFCDPMFVFPLRGWIEIIRKQEKEERLNDKKEKCISITCTGWANADMTVSPNEKEYLIPYSLHSNYQELEYFVRGVQPAILKTVVRNTSKSEKINRISTISSYMSTLMHLKQRGVDYFQEHYVQQKKLSCQYRELQQNEDLQQQIKDYLELNNLIVQNNNQGENIDPKSDQQMSVEN